MNIRNYTSSVPAEKSTAAIERLLVDAGATEKGLKQIRAGTQQRILEQAERTTWKLLHDWVHVQLSLIQMGQAEPAQVFMPYAYDSLKDETLEGVLP